MQRRSVCPLSRWRMWSGCVGLRAGAPSGSALSYTSGLSLAKLSPASRFSILTASLLFVVTAALQALVWLVHL